MRIYLSIISLKLLLDGKSSTKQLMRGNYLNLEEIRGNYLNLLKLSLSVKFYLLKNNL